jgi:hypothetical protein
MNITVIVLVICVSFFCFIFFYFKWYIKRRTTATELLSEYRSEVYRLITEIDSVTDRNLQLVEDRINKLKSLSEETDKRIAVYGRELEKSRTGEALYTSLGRGIRAALNTQPSPPPPSAAAGTLKQSSAASIESSQQNAPKPHSKKQIRSLIETMIKEGQSPAQIASHLDISRAEVELAMTLLNRNI